MDCKLLDGRCVGVTAAVAVAGLTDGTRLVAAMSARKRFAADLVTADTVVGEAI